jgi:hypothetical protein
MENTRKCMGVFVLLVSLFGDCVAKNTVQSINIQNDTGDDLYIALVKTATGEGGAMLFYEGKDSVRMAGKDGLVKAGSSVTIKNFPWNARKNYFHTLFIAKSLADLNAGEIALKKQNYADFEPKYIKLSVWLGNSSGGSIGGMVTNTIDEFKIRIFKANDGQYSTEFIFPEVGKTA